MKKHTYLILSAAVCGMIVLSACGGASTVKEGEGTASKDGLKGKVHKVQTLIYNAKANGAEIVKNGKPDIYREIEYFPMEDTRIYNAAGQLDSVIMMQDATKYITVYAYQDGKVSNEKMFMNGELLTDRKFVYQDGNLVNTIEEVYIGGDKTTSEYPVDPAKIEMKDGNRIEYGDSERNYVVKDAQGRIIKISNYNEMDEYLEVREYTYDSNGWLTAASNGETGAKYEYPAADEQGNWTRCVITMDGQPYGIVERTITYY